MGSEVALRIPTALSEVQAADEGKSIIDHNHLLMVRCPDRMVRVFHEMQSPMCRQL
jgi:hypothetical protein